MQSFRHILFPVDFSDRCEASKPLIASWAQWFKSKITLLHTIQIPISAYGPPDGYPTVVDIPAIEAIARERLARFEMPGAERIVKVGDPAFEIIEYAGKSDVDLIMMPTHGYGKFRSLLLGSVAAKVLHDTACPVWTSAHVEDHSRQGRSDIRSILCVVDDSQDLTGPAKELAGAFRAKLQLISAGAGSAGHLVQDAAILNDADLVVTGRGKLHETFGRLRSNAYEIIRDSPCPVLSM